MAGIHAAHESGNHQCDGAVELLVLFGIPSFSDAEFQPAQSRFEQTAPANINLPEIEPIAVHRIFRQDY